MIKLVKFIFYKYLSIEKYIKFTLKIKYVLKNCKHIFD